MPGKRSVIAWFGWRQTRDKYYRRYNFKPDVKFLEPSPKVNTAENFVKQVQVTKVAPDMGVSSPRVVGSTTSSGFPGASGNQDCADLIQTHDPWYNSKIVARPLISGMHSANSDCLSCDDWEKYRKPVPPAPAVLDPAAASFDSHTFDASAKLVEEPLILKQGSEGSLLATLSGNSDTDTIINNEDLLLINDPWVGAKFVKEPLNLIQGIEGSRSSGPWGCYRKPVPPPILGVNTAAAEFIPTACDSQQTCLNDVSSAPLDARDGLIHAQSNTIAVLASLLERLGYPLFDTRNASGPTLSGVSTDVHMPQLSKIAQEFDAKLSARTSCIKELVAETSRDILNDVKRLIDGSNSLQQETIRSCVEKTMEYTDAVVKKLGSIHDARLTESSDMINKRIDQITESWNISPEGASMVEAHTPPTSGDLASGSFSGLKGRLLSEETDCDEEEEEQSDEGRLMPNGSTGGDFRSCPSYYWEAIYDNFDIDFSQQPSVASDASPDCLDPSRLSTTFLSLGEFGSMFLPMMNLDNVKEIYGENGLQDLDEGIWYRIAPTCELPTDDVDDAACVQLWGKAEIEVWIQVTFRHMQSMESSEQRHDHVRKRWDAAAEHIPSTLHGPTWDMLSDALQRQEVALRR